MLRFALVTCALFAALPASADQSICRPAASQWYAATGLASNDTLNLRESASGSARIVARVKPGGAPVQGDGRIAFSNKDCEKACRMANFGVQQMAKYVRSVCLPGNSVWYGVSTKDRKRGWANARFLTVAAPPSPDKPNKPNKPGKEVAYSFTCDSGQRLRLIVVPAEDGARLIDKSGQISYLTERDKPKARIDYYNRGTRSKQEIRGNADKVAYVDPKGKKTTCYSVP